MTTPEERFYSKGYYKGFACEPRFDVVAKLFSQQRAARFLDVGCGDGDITLMIKNNLHAQEVYGLDIAAEAVAVANKKGVCAFKIDIDNDPFPFDDQYFDTAYCGEIIEHVYDTDHLLSEVFRVLKPKGRCIITTPNLAGWASRFALLMGYEPYPMAVSPKFEGLGKLWANGGEGQWGHIRVMTLRALKDLVELHGFRVVQTVGCTVSVKSSMSSSLLGFVNSVDKVMAKFPSMSSRVILVVEKNSTQGAP